MKIVGVGIDIIDITRIKKAKNLDRLTSFFFLEEELFNLEKNKDKVQFIASRIALKEAIIKAMPEKIYYHDFKLLKESEKIKAIFFDKKYKKFEAFLSLAHEFKHAIGYAIITAK